jgi:hypothetical protein
MTMFFSHLNSAKLITDIPAQLYDLLQENADVHHEWIINIHYKTLGKKSFYILSQKENIEDMWELTMTSLASVIEILHCSWGLSLVCIACHLLDRGISFNTFIHGNPAPPLDPKFIPAYPGLSCHLKGYKLDCVDYASYELC